MIEISNVTHTFAPRGSSSKPYTAVVDVDLTVEDGEFVSIVGPSGCGKSTLLTLVSGLEPFTGGSIEVKGEPVVATRRDVGFLFQSDALLPWRTVVDNIAMGLRFRGVGRAPARERAGEWARRVGLGGFERYYPKQLSGGMRKRAQLAATLICEPEIILMDEPFGALDAQTRAIMEDDLLDIWSTTSATVVFVTHDLDEAIALADRVVVMTAGPGTIRSVYDITLERPRKVTEIRDSEAFWEIRKKISEDLREEVTAAQQSWNTQ